MEAAQGSEEVLKSRSAAHIHAPFSGSRASELPVLGVMWT